MSTFTNLNNVFVSGALYDSANSAGTNGQVLTSTVTGTDWKTLSEITGVDGVGTSGYVARWIDTDTIGTGVVYDNGTNVGIRTASPSTRLHIVTNTSDLGESGGITIEGSGTGARTWQLVPTPSDTLLLAIPGLRVAAFNSAGKFFAGGLDGTSGAGARFTASLSGITVGTNYSLAIPTPQGAIIEGRVGIGTTSPTAQLHVNAASATTTGVIVRCATSQSADLQQWQNSVGGDIASVDANGSFLTRSVAGYQLSNGRLWQLTGDLTTFNIYDATVGATRLTINSSGNVGIGTTSPSSKLTIASGDIEFTTNGQFGLKWPGGSRLYEQTNSTGGVERMLYQANGDRFEVLTENGAAFIAGFHGSNSALANTVRLYGGTIIGNTYASNNSVTSNNGLLVEGNVGIGTTNPQYLLDVSGTIRAGSTIDVFNALQMQPSGTGAGQTSPLRFYELATNGTHFVGFRAPNSIAANVTWALPSGDGTANQLLKTDGAGNLGWASASATATDTDLQPFLLMGG